jgi:hypothetical protein
MTLKESYKRAVVEVCWFLDRKGKTSIIFKALWQVKLRGLILPRVL